MRLGDLDALKSEFEWLLSQVSEGSKDEVRDVIKRIDNAPTVDAAPVVHGEWLLRHIGHGHYWECSNCHTNPCIYVTENTKFCPNCGARMDGERRNDEQDL